MIYTNKNYNDLIEKTAELVNAFNFQPTIVFCEDKITLAIEQAITAKCGGSIFCEVTTLNRFMKRLSDLKDVCSKQTISLIIKKLLSQHNNELTTFKNVNSPSLPGALAELIAQLKSAKVSPTVLKNSAKNFNEVFKYKINDVSLIYQKYEEYLEQNNLLDTNSKFSLFVDKIKDFNLEKYNVIIAGFQSVTAQTATLFKEISSRAKRLDFVVLQGQEDLYVNEIYNFALGLNQTQAKTKKPQHERYHLLDNLFKLNKNTPLYSDKVKILSYLSEEDEIIDVAKQIKQKVIKGAKWEDFMVVCSDLESSKGFVKKIFSDYEIPYYLEESFNLSTHPLVTAICDLVDLSVKRPSLSQYKKVLRHTTLFSDSAFIDEYLNFLTVNSFSMLALLNALKRGEKLDEGIYDSFARYVQNLPSFNQEEKAESFVDKTINLLNKLKVTENLGKLSNRLKEQDLLEHADFIENGYDYVIKALQEIKVVLAKEVISAREFKSLLVSSATYTNLAVIPQKGDRVYVGDFSNCKYRFSKNLFVIGLNSNVPFAMADTSILTNSDLKRLDEIKVIIEPKLDIVNARNKENIGVCLSNFTDSLTLSYPTTLNGKTNLKSELLLEVCSCFVDKENNPLSIVKASTRDNNFLKSATPQEKLEQEALKYLSKSVALKSFALDVSNYKYLGGTEGSFSTFYSACETDQALKSILDEIISSANSTLGKTIKGSGELFFPDKKVSASGIERFYSCPYAHFIEKGLKVSDNDNGEINALNLGSFLHSVYEIFLQKYADQTFTDEELETLINELVDNLLDKDDYKKYTKKAIYNNLFVLLKKEIKNVLKTVIEDSKKTSFKPTHLEYSFGFKNDEKRLIIKTKGGNYDVRGKIDRVDFCGDLVRIIDYKTGVTSNFESVSKLFGGNKLQLYLYLNIFLDSKHKPAGVYYAPMNDEFVSFGSEKGKTLKGKTVNDVNVLSKTDSDYQNGSTIIDANIDAKTGELELKNVLTEQTLLALCKYARIITARAIEKIKADYAVISPTKDACKYCSFGALCGFTREKFDTNRPDISITEEQLQEIAEGTNE